MNGRFDLHIITQSHSEVYCGYFRRLVFGNSFIITFSHIPPYFHAKPPNFPRLIGPREMYTVMYKMIKYAKLDYIHAFLNKQIVIHAMLNQSK